VKHGVSSRDRREERPAPGQRGAAIATTPTTRTTTWVDRAHEASRSLGLRLRFAGALLLLVLPLGAAAWAFGEYAAANKRARTDAKLESSLRAAVSEYGRLVDDSQVAAMRLATSRSVQRALSESNHTVLARLRRKYPNMEFVVGTRHGHGGIGAIRTVAVGTGDRVVGSIVVDVPLDRATLARVADRAGLLDEGEIAVALRGHRIVAASIPLAGSLALTAMPRTVGAGGERYRAVAGPLTRGTSLAVLAPYAAVQHAATSIRGQIFAIGLLVLAGVMVIAYALAPALARTRVARRQRVIAERVLEHVADGVLLLDQHGIVRFWNQAAEAITGLPARKVLRQHAERAIPGWQAAVERIPVGDARGHHGGGGASSATVPLDVGSEELWLDVSGVRFDDGTVYTFRDITEDERLDQAKTDFVATVSHELRTPLASVYGAAVTLQKRFDGLGSAERGQLLALLAEQASRLSSIIDELLLASKLAGRIDSGRVDIDAGQFDADEVARVVVQAAQLHAPHDIAIGLSSPPWLPHAAGDGDKVAQVLANLVENAVKYSPGGGHIDVVLEQADDRIRFSVRDPGLGIPLDEQERIFKKFYRLDPNLRRGIGGTGLGLYICRELMRRMDSDIHVDSTLGVGSTFWFELPVAKSADRVPEPAASVG
jgi:PAS domain S-box-containing protein